MNELQVRLKVERPLLDVVNLDWYMPVTIDGKETKLIKANELMDDIVHIERNHGVITIKPVGVSP